MFLMFSSFSMNNKFCNMRHKNYLFKIKNFFEILNSDLSNKDMNENLNGDEE